MAGQLWAIPEEGGYLYSDELSNTLRSEVQPLTKLRQLADAEDGTEKGLNKGEKFHWNTYSKVGRQGRALAETKPMPETNFTLLQKDLTVTEYGNSVPYTGKLESLGKQDVVNIIDKALADDARKCFDIRAYEEFDKTPLRATPSAGNSIDTVDLATNGIPGVANNVALGTGHVKAIVDLMKERNIPSFKYDDYACVTHPTTYRNFKNQLEDVHKYTDTGIGHVYNGEVGRYESCRFIEQNHIPKGGAYGSATFDPWESVPDPWPNNLSSWAFFMGKDTVTEAIVLPEEMRAKIPGDFGRSKAIAWYYLGDFGCVHTDALNARIVKWDSAAS